MMTILRTDLEGISFGDTYNNHEIYDYRVNTWIKNVHFNSWMSGLCMFVQIDNIKTGRQFYRGDIETEEEFAYKMAELIDDIEAYELRRAHNDRG